MTHLIIILKCIKHKLIFFDESVASIACWSLVFLLCLLWYTVGLLRYIRITALGDWTVLFQLLFPSFFFFFFLQTFYSLLQCTVYLILFVVMFFTFTNVCSKATANLQNLNTYLSKILWNNNLVLQKNFLVVITTMLWWGENFYGIKEY